MDYRDKDHHEDEDLLLEELMSHGEEGDGQPTAEEEDEGQSQLVPDKTFMKMMNLISTKSLSKIPVVDGEGQVVPWRRKTMSTTSCNRCGEPSG